MTPLAETSPLTKMCFKCGIEKFVDLFSLDKNRKNGRYPYCKQCRKANHSLIAPSIAKKERVRRLENYAKIKSNPDRYAKVLRQMAVVNKMQAVVHRDRNKSRKAVAYAVRVGKLHRPDSCSECGCVCKPHAHHDSYLEENKLNVIWLCRPCHGARHRKYPEQPE
jgi:hypothetical protein